MKLIISVPLTLVLCTTALASQFVDDKSENKLLFHAILFKFSSMAFFQLLRLNQHISNETYRSLCTVIDSTWPIAFTFIHPLLNQVSKDHLSQGTLAWFDNNGVMNLNKFTAALTNGLIAPLIFELSDCAFNDRPFTRTVKDSLINIIAGGLKQIVPIDQSSKVIAFAQLFVAGLIQQLIVNNITKKSRIFEDKKEATKRSFINGVIYAISKNIRIFGESIIKQLDVSHNEYVFYSYFIYVFFKKGLEELTNKWHKNESLQKSNSSSTMSKSLQINQPTEGIDMKGRKGKSSELTHSASSSDLDKSSETVIVRPVPVPSKMAAETPVELKAIKQPSMITPDFIASSAILGGLIVGGMMTGTVYTTALVPMCMGVGILVAGKCVNNYMKNNKITNNINLLKNLTDVVGASIFVLGSYYAFPFIIENGLNYLSANTPEVNNQLFYNAWLMTKDLLHMSSFTSALAIASIPTLATEISNSIGNMILPNKVSVEKISSGIKGAAIAFVESYPKYFTDRVIMPSYNLAAPITGAVSGAVGGFITGVIESGIPKNLKSCLNILATTATSALNYVLYTPLKNTSMYNEGFILVGIEAATLAFDKSCKAMINSINTSHDKGVKAL